MEINQILSLASLILSIYFLLILIIIHLLTKKLSFSDNWLSEFVNIKYGKSLKIGFILIALTEMFLSFLLFNIFENTLIAAIFLFMSGLGALIVGIFDFKPREKWTIGDLPHSMGVILQFSLLPIACLFYFITIPNKLLSTISLIFGLITVILGLYIATNTYFLKNKKYIVIFQKVNILVINIWLIIISIISIKYFF